MFKSHHTIQNTLVFFLYFSASLYASDVLIMGHVTDPSGIPIPYVQAYLKDEGIGTTTDRNGQFLLQFNHKQKNTLLIEHSAYTRKTIVLDTVGKELLNIILEPKTYYFDPITVEGNLYAQESLRLPVSHRLVRIAHSENWGNSVGDRLDHSGIQTKDYGGSAGLKTAASPTGYSEHILVMIESLPLNSPQNGGFDFSFLPADLFTQGEYYLGHGSSLYGSSAIGGVLNLMVDYNQPSYIRIKSGSFGEKGISGKGAVNLGSTRVSIFGSQYESLGNFRQNNDFDQNVYNTEFSLPIGKLWKIRTFLLRSTTNRGISGSLEYPSPNARKDNNDTIHLFSMNGLSQWGQSEILLGTTGSKEHFTDADWSIDSKHLVSSQRFRAVHRFPEKNSIQNTFILDIAKNRVDSDDAGDHHELLGAAGWLGQFRLRPAIYLSPSIRTDWSNIRSTSLATGGFAILWKPESRFLHSLSMNIGTSYRNPTFNDLYWEDPWGYSVGNPKLKPERGISEEIAVELPRLIDELLQIKVRGYYFFNNDLIQWIPDTNWIYSPTNLNKTESRGSDITISFSGPTIPFKLLMGVERNTSQVLSKTAESGKRLLYVPGISYWGEFSYRTRIVNLYLSYRYLGKRRYSYVEGAFLNPYNRLDVILNLKSPKILGLETILDVGVRNLQDRKNQESVYGYPEPGRVIFSRLSFEIP